MKRSEAKLAVRSSSVAEAPMTLTVGYPTQTFFPIKYNGFEMGGMTLTVQIPARADSKLLMMQLGISSCRWLQSSSNRCSMTIRSV
jgi:hypothetical protein